VVAALAPDESRARGLTARALPGEAIFNAVSTDSDPELVKNT